jgi:hypothetical protein
MDLASKDVHVFKSRQSNIIVKGNGFDSTIKLKSDGGNFKGNDIAINEIDIDCKRTFVSGFNVKNKITVNAKEESHVELKKGEKCVCSGDVDDGSAIGIGRVMGAKL